jgi:signal transduction histidine kinase
MNVPPRAIFAVAGLGSVLFFLVGGGLAILWHLVGFRNEYVIRVYRLFDLSTDQSIPTWYNSILHLMAAALLLLIAAPKWRMHDQFRWHWLGLAFLFLGFSIDEVAMIHESFGGAISRDGFGQLSGIFYYSWVLVGLGAVVLVGMTYFRFLLKLSKRSRTLFVLSAAIFVGGGIGVEMLNGAISERHGSWNLGYALMTGVEELMEMGGISIFLYALADYNQRELPIHLSNAESSLPCEASNYHDEPVAS